MKKNLKWLIAAALISIPTASQSIPDVIVETMRAYCEVQAGEYTACMRDQYAAYEHQMYGSVEQEVKAIRAECAKQYPAHDDDYRKCASMTITCSPSYRQGELRPCVVERHNKSSYREAVETVKAECAKKYPAHDDDYRKCSTSMTITCPAPRQGELPPPCVVLR